MAKKQKSEAVAVKFNLKMSKSDKIALARWKLRGVSHRTFVRAIEKAEDAYASFRRRPVNFMTTLKSMGIKLDKKYGGDGD
jgi:hypothetical protein